jgi:hypothetical protein
LKKILDCEILSGNDDVVLFQNGALLHDDALIHDGALMHGDDG